MDQSDLQSEVIQSVVNRETEEIEVGISDSENIVLVNVDGGDAAFTADEARDFAKGLKSLNDQKWEDVDVSDMVEYIRDLADVVDNDRSIEQFKEKWRGRDITTSL
jgi:hypothetical protein